MLPTAFYGYCAWCSYRVAYSVSTLLFGML